MKDPLTFSKNQNFITDHIKKVEKREKGDIIQSNKNLVSKKLTFRQVKQNFLKSERQIPGSNQSKSEQHFDEDKDFKNQ